MKDMKSMKAYKIFFYDGDFLRSRQCILSPEIEKKGSEMKTYLKSTWVYLLILILCTATSAMAASFTADLVTTEKGKTKTEKFYVMDSYYRMDVVEDGKPMVVIADRKKNVHLFLQMEEKVFFEIPSDDFRILINDPFKASEYMVSKYESKVEGDDQINGINCEKQVLTAQGTKIHSRWFSNDLKFPVKLVSYEGDKEIYIVELRNIEKTDLQMDRFTPPADFKRGEEPGAAERRKREKLKKAEEALPGLTGVKTTQVPCYEKIAAGGELRVQMDTDRKAYLKIINQAKGESELTIFHYRNGKPIGNYPESTKKIGSSPFPETWDYNDEFDQKTGSFLVDELRIKVEKGLVYAGMTQQGPDRRDFYNWGNLQSDGNADPKRPLTVQITGDNPFGDQTKGKFYLDSESGGSSEAIPFTVETGKTLTWDYPAEKKVNTVKVFISAGNGRAKISLIQPPYPEKPAPKQTVKKTPKPKYTPKAKPVTQFTVTHPYGTGKPLTPGKDLIITVTGRSSQSSGDIFLYTDRTKSKKIDTFKFKLKKKQVKSFSVSGEKDVGWAGVWVHDGSFKVKLDQSPGAKAAPAPKTTQKPTAPVTKTAPKAASTKAAPAPKPTQKPAAPAASAAPAAANGTIFNDKVPLMEGAKVLKTKTYGTNSKADLEVPATPQEIVDFYKQAMTEKGWKPGMSMVMGDKGVLQLMGSAGQLIIKAKGQGQTSKVNMALMGQ